MARFHCRIPGHKFTAYQRDEGELPSAVGVALLERPVGPDFRDVERTIETQVTPIGGGKPRVERQVVRSRERIARTTAGRGVLREVLEVEANDEHQAAAIYRRAVGLAREGTSREIEVKPATAAPAAGSATTGDPAAAQRPLTAEEEARRLVGGNLPAEE